MTTEICIHALPGGGLRAIYPDEDRLDLRRLGGVPRRASHVEMIQEGPQRGQWYVDLSPLGEPHEACLLETFPNRRSALDAEHNYLLTHWL